MFSKDFESAKRDLRQKFQEIARDSFSEVVKLTPIDTGDLKKSWEYTKISDWKIEFETNDNTKHYASIINRGRRFYNGRWYGSEQLPLGFAPLFRKITDKIAKEVIL